MGPFEEPGRLTERQDETLRRIKLNGGVAWRAYEMKESLHAVFGGDLSNDEVSELLDRWGSRASRSRIPSFVRLSKTIRSHKAASWFGWSLVSPTDEWRG